MKQGFEGLYNKTKCFIKKYSPEILTGIGLTGMLSSTVLAVTATPKAIELINKKKQEENRELTVIETVKIYTNSMYLFIIHGMYYWC